MWCILQLLTIHIFLIAVNGKCIVKGLLQALIIIQKLFVIMHCNFLYFSDHKAHLKSSFSQKLNMPPVHLVYGSG